MNTMKVKFVVLLLIAGLLSACGSQVATTATSQPAATQAPATAAATDQTGAATQALATEPVTVQTEAATQAPAAGAAVSFANDALPLFQSRCVNCHGGQKTEKGLTLNSYDAVMAGSENGPVVTASDAANSKLAQMVVNGKMPKRGPKLTPAEVKLIVEWIDQGAKNN